MLNDLLGRVCGGQNLTMDEMATVIDQIMRGQVAEQQIALLLTALRTKGETEEEVAGAASAMRRHMTRIRSRHTDLIDTCGTGGSGAGTFNISTAAALVAAAAGAHVAKHGNRHMSSKTGSADVLAELGVNIEAPLETVERCLDELGICFCFAPLFHSAMKHVGPVRRKLGVPTIFNLLGPLCNPAGAPRQLLGVGRPELRNLLAGALARLGTERAVVVHGEDGLCELTISGATEVTEVAGGRLHPLRWEPEDFGIPRGPTQPLKVDSPAASAALIRQVLAGRPGPARDIVLLNAAAALWVAGKADDLKRCAALACEAIDTGAARQLLERLVEYTHN